MYTKFWLDSLKVRDYSEDLIFKHNIKTNLKKTGWEGVEWIQLAQNRGRWKSLMNTVMKHRVV
jgi:hypothetical protein